jgi:metal-responsive CopG/Arc/MetJ family transcriptional regulator
MANVKKISISIPEKLKRELDAYNEANPYKKINLSQIAQHALHNELQKRKAIEVNQYEFLKQNRNDDKLED